MKPGFVESTMITFHASSLLLNWQTVGLEVLETVVHKSFDWYKPVFRLKKPFDQSKTEEVLISLTAFLCCAASCNLVYDFNSEAHSPLKLFP